MGQALRAGGNGPSADRVAYYEPYPSKNFNGERTTPVGFRAFERLCAPGLWLGSRIVRETRTGGRIEAGNTLERYS